MISHFLASLLWSGFAAGATLFVGINAGLRLVPSGRAFLAEARGAGRVLASPRLSSAFGVKLIFCLSCLAAMFAGGMTWVLLRSGPV